ncbi:Hsp70 family protein, partial [candidate division WWE3 bacterium]|nr:Hsp70 family protein [candidate division WWE3 bacterium]
FLAEPIAAALSYLSNDSADTTILVFDFGGGTLDFSLVRREQGTKAKVVGTGGLSIGGNTFNEEIMVKILAPFFGSEERWGRMQLPMPVYLKHSLRRWYELDKLQTREMRDFLAEVARTGQNEKYVRNLQDLINYDLGFALFQKIEEAKKTLSNSSEARITFNREGVNLDTTISRDQFEQILDPYEIQIDRALDALLKEAALSTESIDHVIATGGSSQIPKFKQLLADKFGEDKIRYHDIFTGVGEGLALADRLEM